LLVVLMTFGLTFVGCDEEETERSKDTNPTPPTGLTGTALSDTSVSLTWNSVDKADQYYIDYKESSDVGGGHKEVTTTSCTIDNLVPATSYNFKIRVRNTDGYYGGYSSPVTVITLDPATGTVSLPLLTKSFLTSSKVHEITVTLKLSKGVKWTSSPTAVTAKEWVTVTGIDLSSWIPSITSPESDQDTLYLKFTLTGQNEISITSVNITINSSKLAEMKEYTNITATGALTAGTTASSTFSSWN